MRSAAKPARVRELVQIDLYEDLLMKTVHKLVTALALLTLSNALIAAEVGGLETGI